MSSYLAERGAWGSRRGTRSLGMKRSIRRTEKQRWHGKRGKLETEEEQVHRVGWRAKAINSLEIKHRSQKKIN